MNAVIRRTPLVLRPRKTKVDLDAETPGTEALPPPLLPLTSATQKLEEDYVKTMSECVNNGEADSQDHELQSEPEFVAGEVDTDLLGGTDSHVKTLEEVVNMDFDVEGERNPTSEEIDSKEKEALCEEFSEMSTVDGIGYPAEDQHLTGEDASQSTNIDIPQVENATQNTDLSTSEIQN